MNFILWLILYSIVGWIYETTLCSVEGKKFVNRGFLNGPYCPIYGFGAMLDILLIGWIRNPIALFFAGMLVTCALEYFTSWLLEVLFHAKWWDYSYMKYHVRGRVCLLGAVVFGAFSVVLILFIHPFVMKMTGLIPMPVRLILTAGLLAIVSADMIYTLIRFSGFQKKLKYFHQYLENVFPASFEKVRETVGHARDQVVSQFEETRPYAQAQELRKKMKSAALRINSQEKRILAAFPRFTSVRYQDVLAKIRQFLKSPEENNPDDFEDGLGNGCVGRVGRIGRAGEDSGDLRGAGSDGRSDDARN